MIQEPTIETITIEFSLELISTDNGELIKASSCEETGVKINSVPYEIRLIQLLIIKQ